MEPKKTIKFQLITVKSAVEMEIEVGDSNQLFVGKNPEPYIEIKVVDENTVQLIVNPAKFPNYQGGKNEKLQS